MLVLQKSRYNFLNKKGLNLIAWIRFDFNIKLEYCMCYKCVNKLQQICSHVVDKLCNCTNSRSNLLEKSLKQAVGNLNL